MLVGITYDLKSDYLAEGYSEEEAAEFDKEETIAGIEQALTNLGYQAVRIGNVKSLLGKLTKGERWDLVFNICEGLHGIGREAQVPALLDIYQIPYVFSDPMVLALALHKGMTKHILRDLGIPTPDFYLVQSPDDIEKVKLPYPLFAKPVAEGTGKGINANSKINNASGLKQTCLELLQKYHQDVLVETFLPGREFTVGIVGTGKEARAIGAMEVIFKPVAKDFYSYENKSNYQELMDYSVPEKEVEEKCGQLAIKAWRGLQCRDGGRVDVRMDDKGVVNFIEVNPLAGLHPIDSDLPIIGYKHNISYQQLIAWIMESALKRQK